MKIAVLMTGQLRSFTMLKDLHYNTIISQYDTDVFLGIDSSNQLQTANENSSHNTNKNYIQEAQDFFNPIKSHISQGVDLSSIEPKVCPQLFGQYYLVKNTYKLLKDHIEDTNAKYDLILRLRYDQLLFSEDVPYLDLLARKIPYNKNTTIYNESNQKLLSEYSQGKKFKFEKLNDNELYVFGFGQFPNSDYQYANDQFFYHTESLIDDIYKFYDYLPELMNKALKERKKPYGGFIENLFHTYITEYCNKKLRKSNIHGVFVRDKNI
jgi:hypothetical protein